MCNNNSNIVTLNGTDFYKISNYMDMKPFLFTLASPSDIWIYLSSYGGITAGRHSSDSAMFPYVPEDVLHHSSDTGSKTLIKVHFRDSQYLWQPFAKSFIKPYEIERNIYKSLLGDSVIFEEINQSLGMSFKYQWRISGKYGLVRTSEISNFGNAQKTEILDGVINILPFGISEAIQKASSCMVDGYKCADLIDGCKAAVYSLTSAFSDTPEPKEILQSTLFRSDADFEHKIFLSEDALNDFAKGKMPVYKTELVGERCCYLINFTTTIKSGKSKEWSIIGDIGVTQQQISEFCSNNIHISIEKDIKATSARLLSIAAMTDGLQRTGMCMPCIHQLSSVIYNDMRGGMFAGGYTMNTDDFEAFLKKKDKTFLENKRELTLPLLSASSIHELKRAAAMSSDPDLYRLCLEYIPVSFSRRHGDPSRPWNKFSIILDDGHGKPLTYYEGNWRDIFQNWEAMCISFPYFYENAVVKFLNSSTADGFNPLRINKFSFEFETPAGTDEWGSLGYSGDHQLIYLIRLIECFRKFDPDGINRLFKNDIFTYADTPYEIAQFEDILKNPKRTILFNDDKHERIKKRVTEHGEDHKYIIKDEKPYMVSFAEKLIVPLISKICNFIPGGGVWMNTQKAEWNDANNAIVGNGLSVVTVCNMRHYLISLIDIMNHAPESSVMMSGEVAQWLDNTYDTLNKYAYTAGISSADDRTKYDFLSEMQHIFDQYKNKIYRNGFTEKTQYKISRIISFMELAVVYIEKTIKDNLRDDGMYNSYNIMSICGNRLSISTLSPMLEGQTAVLDCGILNAADAAALIETMKNSRLYSQRDKSFYLYPPQMTLPFMDRNVIPSFYEKDSRLITELLRIGNTDLVVKDHYGTLRFNHHICCMDDLKKALNSFKADNKLTPLVKKDYELILQCFEDVFNHKTFMGRSQIMYKYEGIGCIYWHQNSKLRLAVLETLSREAKFGANRDAFNTLKQYYSFICDGLCYNKTASEWGAFPSDSYSHTPYTGGASQPVMTGQVKEDIIARFTELGITFSDGCIIFRPELVNTSDILYESSEFEYIGQDDVKRCIDLPAGAYALTLCQVPIICAIGTGNSVTLIDNEGVSKTYDTLRINAEHSRDIFSRNGRVKEIHVEYTN